MAYKYHKNIILCGTLTKDSVVYEPEQSIITFCDIYFEGSSIIILEVD